MNKFKDFLKSFLIWFAIFYLVLWGIEKFFGKKEDTSEVGRETVQVIPAQKEVVVGNLVLFKVQNNLKKKITFLSPCENADSLHVLRVVNAEKTFDISQDVFQKCNGKRIAGLELEPGNDSTFSMRDFNLDFFSEAGKYQLEMKFDTGDGEIFSAESQPVELEMPGMLRQLFRAIVSKPLFNLLVFLTKTLPTHSFGWAIVIMTILVRIALFVPNQKAMKSQRELQKLQPHMEELKQKYGKSQQMLAMKTMELYRTHKISPMSSCLPILFQMPFLIGVYYIVRDGLSPHLEYLLYGVHQGIDLTVVNTEFWGLNLEKNGPIVLAVIIAVAQWGAIKLSFVRAKARADKDGTKVVKKEGVMGQMQQMNRMMLWMMPAMIGFFALSFPAGVGVYWLTSTILGIFQQQLVNWQLDRPQVRRKEGEDSIL